MMGADGKVLAKAALQGATGKENRTAAVRTADAGLFAKMKRRPCQTYLCAAAAKSTVVSAIGPAGAWAKRAMAGDIQNPFDSFALLDCYDYNAFVRA